MASVGEASREHETSLSENIEKLEIDSDTPIKISGCKFLASYNWTNDKRPTIFVPGIALVHMV